MKKYYFYSILVALIVAALTYVYIGSKPVRYRSIGKFLLVNTNPDATLNKTPYADASVNKTITESIKTKFFIKKLYFDSGQQIDGESIISLSDFIEAEVIDESSIVSVNLYSEKKEDLEKINNVFFKSLQNSGLLSVGDTKIEFKIVEPFYTQSDPIALQPIKYSAIAFIAVLTIGMLLVYTFYLPEYYKFLNN